MLLNHLDLFSGIGGFALAARWVGGIRTIGFCDNEKYARQVLAKNFPGVPIYEDVRELHPDVIVSRDGRIDFLTCGFPCQDLSVAGNQKGIEAERSGLFFEITRLSDEILAYCGVRPSLVLENVPNLLAGDGGSWARAVYGELAVRGYCVEWKTLGAAHVGAPHRRLRWWAVCYMANAKNTDEQACQEKGRRPQVQSGGSRCRKDVADSEGQLGNGFDDHPGGCMGSESISEPGNGGWEENLADTRHTEPPRRIKTQEGQQYKSRRISRSQSAPCSLPRKQWITELQLGRSLDGIPTELDFPRRWRDGFWEEGIPRVTTGQKNRVSRLKGLGNAVVPQCAMIPLMRLKEILT